MSKGKWKSATKTYKTTATNLSKFEFLYDLVEMKVDYKIRVKSEIRCSNQGEKNFLRGSELG